MSWVTVLSVGAGDEYGLLTTKLVVCDVWLVRLVTTRVISSDSEYRVTVHVVPLRVPPLGHE
jgi:hypothetical protein